MTAGNDNGTRFASVEIFLPMQGRMLSVRDPSSQGVLVYDHHPVGSEVDPVTLGIAGNDYVTRADIPSPVVRMPFWRRKKIEVDMGGFDNILGDGTVLDFHRRHRSKFGRQVAPGLNGVLDGRAVFKKTGAREAANGIVGVGQNPKTFWKAGDSVK